MVEATAASIGWTKAIATLPSIDQILDRTPLTVTPDTLVNEAIARMGQTFDSQYDLDSSPTASSPALRFSSCVLAVEGLRPVGILTERDVVRLSIAGMDLSQVTLDRVMTQLLVTLTLSTAKTIYDVLALFQQHQIRHLPVVDDRGQLLGIVTRDRLCQILQPANLLKLRQVAELMATEVMHALPVDSLLSIARQMVNDRKSCVVVVEPLSSDPETLIPVGIVTERDMVQFQRLGVNFAETEAQAVMSPPLSCLKPTDSLWQAQQQMHRLRVRRLVVAGKRGELRGILTQTSLLRVFDPVEMAGIIEVMHQQFDRQTQELNRTVQQLGQEIAEQQQVNAALQTSQQQLQTIFNQTFQFIGLLGPNGMVLDANQAALEFVGAELAEVVGRPLWETPWWTHDRGQQLQLQAAIERAAAGEFVRCEFTHRSDRGTIETFDFSIKPVFSAAGQVISLVAEGRNIDDRKQIERQLEAANEELEQRAADRTAELTQVNQSLQEHLEELQITEEEIRQQNEELAMARNTVEQERQRYQELFEFAPDGYLVTDGKGIIQEANHTAAKMLSRQQQLLIGKPIFVFVAGSDRRLVRSHLTQTDRQWTCEAFLQPPRGASFPVELTAVAVMNQSGKRVGWRWLLHDIRERQAALRERKQAEAELIESERRLSTLMNNLPGYVYRVANDRDYTPEFISEGVFAISGYRQEEYLVDRTIACGQEIHPEDADRIWNLVQEAVTARQPYECEYRIITKTGEQKWVWERGQGIYAPDGELLCLEGFVTDISDRKQAEAKIREQAALLDISTDAIYVRDLEDYILFWNRGAEKLYGWSAAEAIGRRSEELFHADPARLAEAIATTMAQGSWQGELHKTTLAGKTVIVDSRWSVVKNEAGQPHAILTVSTDITEKKQLEQQFLRAQRLESIGTLASGIAHDLNNILTPVLAVAQILPRRLPNLDESTQRLLDILEPSVKRGGDLAKQILAFARGSKGDRIPLEVGYLVAEIRKIVRETFPKSIEIQTQIPAADLWLVRADATQIHQTLLNLCVNARDAMPEGGKLTISVENCAIDRTFAQMHLDARVGPYVKISIADTGTGMTPDVLDRIFDPFFTTKEPDKGTGLGLSTVMTIVKNHGGFLNVTTAVGRGTSFEIYLPAIEREEELSCPLPTNLEGNGELILVVDDEAAIGQTIAATLEEHHYQALVVQDGIEAMALYAQQQFDIRLVLVDLLMPSFDGLKLIAVLDKINPQVRIVVMSGIGSNDLEKAIDREGVQGFLAKPFTTQTLLETVREALSGPHGG